MVENNIIILNYVLNFSANHIRILYDVKSEPLVRT